MLTIKQKLKDDGFAVVGQFLSGDFCNNLKQKIKAKISEFILQHACTDSLYFSVVNRWPLTALIDQNSCDEIINLIAPKVRHLMHSALDVFEMDILYKSPYANLATPCHQDVAYVPNKPYLFSTWIPLNNVGLTESPLQFLPQSHLDPVQPAIDFWVPDFTDEFRQTSRWQRQAVTLPINRGDALIFSSTLWHASLDYLGITERFALTIRWGKPGLVSMQIPLPNKVKFGMWNCGEYTENLLRKSLQQLFNIQSENYLHSIQLWQKQLQNAEAPPGINCKEAYLALEKLRILNKAYLDYQGSDGQGIVYANLWKCFLGFLDNY